MCQAANPDTTWEIVARIGMGGEHGPYNPTVVDLGNGWHMIMFGYGITSLDTYLAEDEASDHLSWILVGASGAWYWDVLNLPDDVLKRAQDAVDVATPCVQGG